jgi:predicted nucleic acid-binding protein
MRNGGSAAFLLDTNVLLYTYDSSDATKRSRAIEVVDRLTATHAGALSVQVLGEFFWNATRKLRQPIPAERVERSLTAYAQTWTVFDLTPLIVLEAIRGALRYQFAYWDGLIWATAKLNSVPTVLSEDFNDGALIEGVRFRNPFQPAFDPMAL